MYTYSIDDGVLRIEMPDRLTADRYAEIRTGIFEIIDSAGAFDNLSLDMIHTEYVSSSGLRIIMELMKKWRKLSVINTTLDVYDVMEMTGFTELVTVTKAKRQISVEGCRLIGRGGNGEVYQYSEDSIIKVYSRPGVQLEDIERERQLARKAFILGVPTAITLDTVLVGQYYGVMYEMIGAESVLGLVYKNPMDYDPYILRFADGMQLINSIHTDRDPLLADKKAEFIRWKNDIAHLFTPRELDELDKLVDAIPEDDCLIHGDYHLANVMLQGDELLLIDMDALGYGSPLFEVANFFFTTKGINMLKGRNPLYRLEPEDMDHCWDLVIGHLFAEMEETEKQKKLALIKAMGFLRLVRYGMRHDATEEKMEFVKTELLSCIESL